jgi:mono/diheme cytochrome c family protein
MPPGATRYVTRDDLLALPQVSFTVMDDPNFAGPTEVKGVQLEDLGRSLAAAPTADLVVAVCDDKYRANYPRAYLTQHHPVLILEINGKVPAGWPKDSGGHGYDMGPYMISHAKFTPSFQILSHRDEAQIPWGVVRLEFRDEKTVYGAIAPRGPKANDPAVQAGYEIAQQNCFRCHNMGNEGGQKSGLPWATLSAFAAGSPEYFIAYVRDPVAKNRRSQMPGSPQYDDETMHALAVYFQTFTQPEKP